MWPDLAGQVALITGGTRGVGLAAGLELSKHGAQVVLTYKWGEHNEADIRTQFESVGGAAPLFINADAGAPQDIQDTIQTIADRFGRLDLFVSNVCVAARGGSLEALKLRDLRRSLQASVWPLTAHLRAAERAFGTPVARCIAMSSDGPDAHYPQYDYVALVKASLEALARAENVRKGSGHVFVLRSRQVATESFADMFPNAARALLDEAFADFEIAPESVGRAVLAFASGDLDGLAGQTLSLDRGAFFMDNTLTSAPMLLGALGGTNG